MEIYGFYARKKKVHEIKVDLDKAIMNTSVAVIMAHNLTGSAFAEGIITGAWAPLKATLQELAEPVSYGFCIKGFMQVMSGNSHEGKQTIKWALGGLAGIYAIPTLTSTAKSVFAGK
ncbi:hypothetical protein [Anaerosolibacter sp.]|uniref:hypothetical protein n=1 Tax=Anaerosolibacter sp. TaxID=1872527 RepID=UPI0039F13AC2